MSKIVDLTPYFEFQETVETHFGELIKALENQPAHVALPCYLAILVAKDLILRAARGKSGG